MCFYRRFMLLILLFLSKVVTEQKLNIKAHFFDIFNTQTPCQGEFNLYLDLISLSA